MAGKGKSPRTIAQREEKLSKAPSRSMLEGMMETTFGDIHGGIRVQKAMKKVREPGGNTQGNRLDAQIAIEKERTRKKEQSQHLMRKEPQVRSGEKKRHGVNK